MLLLFVFLVSVDGYLMNNPEPVGSEETLTERVQMLMTEVLHLKNDVSDLKSQLSVLKAKDVSVAFYAYLANDLVNLTARTSLTFSGIRTNVGDAYDPAHGVFVAPVSGTYNFAFTGSAQPQSQDHGVHIFLKKNGVNELYVFFDHNDKKWIQHGSSAILHLARGDRIWLETGDIWGSNILGGSRASDNAYHSHFSGFLIQAD
uniref:Complement C1q tumor necrosis factor-related protein 3-like n=1 Tax=Crassostrea virginica TaxID=6565 RepID=A0A8B8AVC5_CRAVI|nr:complement C1q tumor necrosis factor-related protein 3-like [Crassostrea virginica]